jgi:hypothetical protein
MSSWDAGENRSVDWLNVDSPRADRDEVQSPLKPAPALAGSSGQGHRAGRPDGGATTAPRRRRATWWKELLVIVWLYWLYDAVNNLTAVRDRLAFKNGSAVIRLEQRLHIDPEQALNHWLSHHNLLGLVLSDFYNVVHLDLTFVVICWLWWKAPPNYRVLRNTLVLTNVVGFVVFMLYPVAPPRMLPGYVDTVVDTHAWFSSHSQGALAKAANQFAAMPSLHVAWAVWVTLAVWSLTRLRVVRLAALAHPVLTVVAILATANHYLLDAVAGLLTLAVCLAVAGWWAQRRQTARGDAAGRSSSPLDSRTEGDADGGDLLSAIA